MEITSLDQLDLNGSYTYADYLKWKFSERVELFKGKILKMSPAPARKHQEISYNLNGVFYNRFRHQQCRVYSAPFDVKIPRKDGLTNTVVQPDLCVVCDLEKLDDRGCNGAPDLIVEILSPGNSKKELSLKYNLYEESGVREYWTINSLDKNIQIFVLENGIFVGKRPIVDDGEVQSYIFPDLKFSATEIFENIDL